MTNTILRTQAILIVSTLFCLVVTHTTNAQTGSKTEQRDTLYFGVESGFVVPCKKEKAIGYTLKSSFNGSLHKNHVWYLLSGTLLAEYESYDYWYKNKENNVQSIIPIKNGEYKEWYLNGSLKTSCTYTNDKLNGNFTIYHPNGAIKRFEKWENGSWLSGDCFDEAGNKTEYCSYQEMPSFEGGLPGLMNYIGRSIKYPPLAQHKGIEGTVYVHFIITPQGYPTQIQVTKSVHPDLDAEAIRIVTNMPAWQPGRVDGSPVDVEFTLPLRFKLQ